MSGIPLLITAGISGASESSLSLSDVTTGNTSTLKHGLAPKLSGVSTEFLNGSGIAMSGSAFLSFGASGFAVNAGTGYCIRGTGTVLYDRMSFSHSALDAENVKIQNTLTLLTYTTTPSIVA